MQTVLRHTRGTGSVTAETGHLQVQQQLTSMSKTLLAVSRAHFFQAGMSEWKLKVQRQMSRNFIGRSGTRLRHFLCPVSRSSLQRSHCLLPWLVSTSFHDTQLAASTSFPPSAVASPALLTPQ